MTCLNDLKQQIESNVARARAKRDSLVEEMRKLSADGMYAVVPRQEWQDRNGNGEYLTLHFHTDGSGNYQGPGGKRKLYIGNKPKKIDKAKRMIQNRVKWKELETQCRGLNYSIQNIELDLERIEQQLNRLAEKSERW